MFLITYHRADYVMTPPVSGRPVVLRLFTTNIVSEAVRERKRKRFHKFSYNTNCLDIAKDAERENLHHDQARYVLTFTLLYFTT